MVLVYQVITFKYFCSERERERVRVRVYTSCLNLAELTIYILSYLGTWKRPTNQRTGILSIQVWYHFEMLCHLHISFLIEILTANFWKQVFYILFRMMLFLITQILYDISILFAAKNLWILNIWTRSLVFR